MSALAEALVAAQRRSISQLEKVYVAGGFEEDRMRELLDSIGCADVVDQDHLIAALDTIRNYGGQVPSEPKPNGKPEDTPATDAQMSLIRKLAQEKNQPVPDPPLTKAQAHEVIDTLRAGTYDAGRWSVPF